MGDEGLGVHFIKAFNQSNPPENLEILDGGTGGFHLLSHLQSCPTNIIIDAAMDDQPIGSISLIKPKFASDYPNSLSSHDIGLKDMIESLYLLGNAPKVFLFTVSISEINPMQIELSPEIQNAVAKLIPKVNELVKMIRAGL